MGEGGLITGVLLLLFFLYVHIVGPITERAYKWGWGGGGLITTILLYILTSDSVGITLV